MTQNNFRVYVPIQKSNLNTDENGEIQLNPDGTLDIEGIASTTNVDLQKDIILPSAIESMKKQLLTKPINLHGDHNYSLNGVLGSVNKVFDSSNDKLHIGCRILKNHAPMVKEMLENNIALGYSIGGKPTAYTKNNVGGYGVKDLNLYEISLTPFPANMDTLGTVHVAKTGTVEGTCFAGVCNTILKNMKFEENNNMADNNPNPGNDENNEDIDSKIKNTVDELWAEKQQGLCDDILEQIRAEVKDLVKDEVENLNDDGNKGNENNEGNASSEGDEGNMAKSLDMSQLTEVINKSIQDTFGDFKKQFFGDLEGNRNPQPHLTKKVNGGDGSGEGSTMKKTYNTRETAEILMKRQATMDPIMNAVKQNLE